MGFGLYAISICTANLVIWYCDCAKEFNPRGITIFLKKITMKPTCAFLLCLISFSANHLWAQRPNTSKGPQIIVQKEFCLPEEYADDGSVADSAPKLIDEGLIGNILRSFAYQTVYKKLDDGYTVTKWKIKNQYNEKQIDTIITIRAGRQSDRLVYYKMNRSAGVSLPGLINARINRNVFDASGIKVGMTRKEVEGLIGEKTTGSSVVITNEPQNMYLSLHFTNDLVSGMSYSSYLE
jgi:hypothetical protein